VRSKHFTVAELVSPAILDNLGPDLAWRLVKDYASSLDLLRDMLDAPIWINSIAKGLSACGVRSLACGVGAPKSRHKGFGGVQAFDLHAKDLAALVSLVRKHSKALGIVRMESTKHTSGWIHIELLSGPVTSDLIVFNP